MPSDETGVSFENRLTEDEHFNIIKYLYFYNGGGVAAGDVNNDGLPDLYFTANQLPDRLYLNKGNFQFEDVTLQAGVFDDENPGHRWKTGVCMADVNADGWLDIYVCELGHYKSVQGRNRLYINKGDGTFDEKAEAVGLAFKGYGQQATFFDYDNDGDLDCFLLNHSIHSAASYAPAQRRNLRDPQASDRLFRNDEGHFTDVTEEAGILGGAMSYGLGVVNPDLNADGRPDVYVCNDFHENDYLYLNLGTAFSESIASATGHTTTFSMGVDAADLNNDGRIDLMSLDMKPRDPFVLKASAGADAWNLFSGKVNFGYHYQYPHNALQLNLGNNPERQDIPVFVEMAQMAGVDATDWSWSVLLQDFDLDGWKDIFVTNGIWRRPNDLDYLRYASNEEVQRNASDQQLADRMPPGLVPNIAFRNTTDGFWPSFENVAQDWGLALMGCSNGAAWADLDADGDPDLVVNNLNAPAGIYKNTAVEKQLGHWLRVKCTGPPGNPFGHGARVELFAEGKYQIQELLTTRGWQSSVEPVLLFGLGKATRIDSLRIHWPGGASQILFGLPANNNLVLNFAEAAPNATGHANQQTVGTQKPAPILLKVPAPPKLVHTENRFVDFNVEPLMPWMLSSEGPKIAVADLDGNGNSSFYLCASKGRPGQLWMPRGNGWMRQKLPAFDDDFLCEDAGAVFFDADNDGDTDLYVVSGGGEYPEGAQLLQDRLYLNQGNGHFEKAASALPPIALNGSCVVAADFDQDGDTDLFTGSRSVPGSYGLSPRSVFLRNDGAGHFTEDSAFWNGQDPHLGMVTAACWLPQAKALIVAGEWMPLSFLFFEEGKIAKKKEQAPGLWQSLHAADLDGDGDTDLLAGNIGLNTDLKASEEQPLELFVNDFDDNGATEPIITLYRQGQRHPLVGKDDIVSRMPAFKKRFVKYADFAAAAFDEIFDEKSLLEARHHSASELQTCWLENTPAGFIRHPMPAALQCSPVLAFCTTDLNGDGLPEVLAGGNRYQVQPYIGRFDAGFGYLLRNEGEGRFAPVLPQESGFFAPGELRSICLLTRQKNGQFLIAGRNNAPALLFKLPTSFSTH